MKAFVKANRDWKVCYLLIYQGTITFDDELCNKYIPNKCLFHTLTDSLVPGPIVYFGRYLCTFNLAVELDKRAIKCCGTPMKNRISAAARDKLETDKSQKIEEAIKFLGRKIQLSLWQNGTITSLFLWFNCLWFFIYWSINKGIMYRSPDLMS